ncbi:DUF1403 family protein [Sinorhizobium meliloti]|uniref:DUF1403 family protein n=1 Tax=Rhizobium meliloti TaxID=382 RepID=UPI000377EEFC|nr:DUF1403 family protein [Sinorhizobium meliloti]
MLTGMDSRAWSPLSPPPAAAAPPGWAVPRGVVASDADAAFFAGSALNSLDNLARSDAVWAGAWRQRLGLKCAVVTVRLMGRSEDEAALRDAVLLTRPGDDPGPAGKVSLAFKSLAAKKRAINGKTMAELAELLAVRWDDRLADVTGWVDDVVQSGRTAPFAVAELVTRVCAARPDAEALAWWLGDRLLAEKLGWERPVPLLMGERYGPAFRTIGGRGRVRPGDERFDRAVCLALAAAVTDALRLGAEIGRRAERLLAVAPKLRTKGADAVVRQLLGGDAVSIAAPGANLSRWASRRLFERLLALDAVCELSGRTSFRIYGL